MVDGPVIFINCHCIDLDMLSSTKLIKVAHKSHFHYQLNYKAEILNPLYIVIKRYKLLILLCTIQNIQAYKCVSIQNNFKIVKVQKTCQHVLCHYFIKIHLLLLYQNNLYQDTSFFHYHTTLLPINLYNNILTIKSSIYHCQH